MSNASGWFLSTALALGLGRIPMSWAPVEYQSWNNVLTYSAIVCAVVGLVFLIRDRLKKTGGTPTHNSVGSVESNPGVIAPGATGDIHQYNLSVPPPSSEDATLKLDHVKEADIGANEVIGTPPPRFLSVSHAEKLTFRNNSFRGADAPLTLPSPDGRYASKTNAELQAISKLLSATLYEFQAATTKSNEEARKEEFNKDLRPEDVALAAEVMSRLRGRSIKMTMRPAHGATVVMGGHIAGARPYSNAGDYLVLIADQLAL